MKVKEMIEKLQKCSLEKEVMFADFIPIRMVIEDDEQVFFTDAENNPELKCEQVIDIDEQMHEQQENDREFAEIQAEMYENLLGGF